ncbi:MAG: ATP-dependent DNA helicase [Acidimicrobiia bacterium]|nr:MAG: ATP-dependent DNA helicase [Acidimicrobiia bacterium]
MIQEFRATDEQRLIISYPAEPLRVAAGAGTGKTTTIVERIAHLVRRGLDPARILGVTFTNKAADELNRRVLAALGLVDADRVPEVSTYHGFAASILDEFGVYVGYNRSSMLMDEGHRSELAGRVLRDVGTSDLDLTSLPTRRRELLDLAATMTDNLLNTEEIRSFAPSGPHGCETFVVPEVWLKRLALTDAVELYEAEKRRLGLMEYGDLIRLAVRVVLNAPETAAEIASRYDAVVLDEYQDTDPAQRRLLTTLFSTKVPVVAVGDTDQTIYEWRGASAENFSAFPLDFPRSDGSGTETLPLSVNRRSDRLILDLANGIHDELPHVDGALPLTPVDDARSGEVITGWFGREDAEAEWIATTIEHEHESGTAWSDVAVLCRKRSHFKPIIDALKTQEIPFSVASMGQLLEVAEIADLLAWLRIIDDPSDEISLLRIWMGGRFRLGMTSVARLRRWCKHEQGRTLFDAAINHREVPDLTQEASWRIATFLALHRKLAGDSQVSPVPVIVDDVIDELGFWDEVAALEQGPGLTTKLNLGKFTDLAQRWRPIEGSPTLSGFLRYLTALDESGRADELAAARPIQSDAVSVMTVHAAKGLEWAHVYVPAVADQVFPARAMAFDNPDHLAQMLPYELRLNSDIHASAAAVTGGERKQILKARHLDQEWRLAYVAVTRAATRIVLTGHAWDGGIKKPRTPSALWHMAHDLDGSTEGPMETVSETRPETSPFVAPVTPPDPLFAEGPAAALRRTVQEPAWIAEQYPELAAAVRERVAQLELAIDDLAEPAAVEPPRRFAASVTNLVNLASCAQRFKWIHHDRLPQKPRRSAVLGTAFHRRIELHNLGVIAFEDPAPETYDADTDPADQPDRSTDPWRLFRASRYWKMTPKHAEAPFEISVGEGSIRGKVDAIYEQEAGGWEIVDYKSGYHRDDPARKVQLEAYAIAAADGALSATPPESIDVTFAYFGGDELTEVTDTVDEQWLDRAREHVAGLVDLGINGPFDPQPSPDCRWCDFLHLCPAGQRAVKESQTT